MLSHMTLLRPGEEKETDEKVEIKKLISGVHHGLSCCIHTHLYPIFHVTTSDLPNGIYLEVFVYPTS